VVFAGWEVGQQIVTGGDYLKERLDSTSPVYRAYERYNNFKGRASWDQVAVLLLSDQFSGYFDYVTNGTCAVSADGSNKWVPGKKSNHSYIKIKSGVDVNQIARTIDEMAIKKNLIQSTPPGAPSGLMVNYIRDSVSAVVPPGKPLFCWTIPQTTGQQSAFEIMVSSSLNYSKANRADVWTSGKMRNDSIGSAIYDGPQLKINQTYLWKVRVWDKKNAPGPYSSPMKFMIKDIEGMTAVNPIRSHPVPPKTFAKKDATSYFIDFGKAAFATLQISYTATQADSVIIHIGEQLENGIINRKPQGSIRYQRIKLMVKPGRHSYMLPIKRDSRNTNRSAIALPDSLPVLMPFRYCEIENVAGSISSSDIRQLAYYSYFDDTQSSFTSSDTILNQVYDLCKYSIKATTFAGIYVDGDRERIPYEADAYINQLSHYATDREYTLARRSIEYFMQHPTWPTEWQLHVAMMFYQDYMYTGNKDLLEKYYEQLKHKTLIELAREDGLISTKSEKNTPGFMQRLGFKDTSAKLSDIIDWPPAQKDTDWKLATAEGERDGFVFMPVNTVVNCFFYKNMTIMTELAAAIGRDEDAMMFKQMALRVKNSINSKLFNPQSGAYFDGEGTMHSSLHANMTALAFDVVPGAHKASVLAFIKSRGMACSVYGAQYLLEGLYNAGEAGYALDLMTAMHDRSWWNMIKIGSTMTLEAWDMKYKPNADWNHAWGAVPANIIARDMWGIKPVRPGASLIRIKPQLGKLTSSSISTPFLQGAVKAQFAKLADKMTSQYKIELPPNMSAQFELELEQGKIVNLNGKAVKPGAQSATLRSGINTILIAEK
jgi:hypothetical protein